METGTDFIFLSSQITVDSDYNHKIKRHLLLGKKAMTNLDRILKSRDITLSTKVCIVTAVDFSSSHVQMWELNHKEGWVPKNWCFPTVVLEKTFESPLHCKEIKLVNPKGNQFWMFIGRTDAEAEAPIFWPPNVKSWLNGKDPDAGKDWRQEEKGTTEDEMVGWRHWLNGHEFEQRTGKPGVLQFMGSQRAGHDLETEQQQVQNENVGPLIQKWLKISGWWQQSIKPKYCLQKAHMPNKAWSRSRSCHHQHCHSGPIFLKLPSPASLQISAQDKKIICHRPPVRL